MIAKVDERLKDRDMGIELTPDGQGPAVAKRGYDPVLGARPLRRTIQREIEDSLSEKILFGELQAGPDRHRRRRTRAPARTPSSPSTASPSPTRSRRPAPEMASEPVVTKSGAVGGPPSGPGPSDGGGTASAVG